MMRDWGWIELLAPEPMAVRARAHLFAIEAGMDGAWRGELTSLHLALNQAPLRPGHYVAHFERGHEYHRVSVRLAAGRAQVRGEDRALPAVALELAEGE